MKKNKSVAVALLVVCSLAVATSASAFRDIKGAGQEKIVNSLQDKGIIQGITKDKFAPDQTLTYAQGVHLVVRAMDLQVMPDFTTGSFANIPASAWYAQSYRIAAQHQIPLSPDIHPSTRMTREQFANILYKAVSATGEYPTVRMYINVADGKKLDQESNAAVQFLLLTKIAKLDEQSNFNPDHKVTRMEAAEMVYNASEFVQSHKTVEATPENQAEPVDPVQQNNISMSIEKANDQQNKVTITRLQAPNPGYGIEVDHIDYVDDTNAVIYYKLTSPKPGEMNIQVITDTHTSTLVDSKYKLTLKAVDGTVLPPTETGTSVAK
ncbi:S-layer homology domain-containing protein [Paenibacillus polymyxa]|uniref:S-layer homology domain-containing protein n=1 Tax=Paenibacillus polymyxa TaxID=1406 RepID=UPI002AB3F68C|nr:S-layer homology domain-containing protein [Paenibacillus polymyxa]MDY8045757.1 S-layer homology domain-containing protein [Paenibacillus polymyxa]